MADRQFSVGGTQSAPADWVLPASLEIIPKTAYASFNGAAAAGSFVPLLRVISDSGHVEGEFPCTTTVAAGGSADVTWFRGVGAAAASGGGGSGLVVLYEKVLAAATASFDTGANGIAPGHGDLVVSLSARSDTANFNVDVQMTLNGDSAADYWYIWLRNSVGTIGSVRANAVTAATIGQIIAANASEGTAPGDINLRIPNYSRTDLNKVGDFTSGWFGTNGVNVQQQTLLGSFAWFSHSAVTRITLTTTGNFTAGSRFVVYGTQ